MINLTSKKDCVRKSVWNCSVWNFVMDSVRKSMGDSVLESASAGSPWENCVRDSVKNPVWKYMRYVRGFVWSGLSND